MQEERAQPRPRPARKSEKQEDRSSSQEEGLPRGGVAVEEEDLFGREFEVSDDDFIG